MNKKFLWVLSLGHAFTDLNQGALPAILPFLIMSGNLSYASAAGLIFAMALSSSIVQPLFGLWADKASKSWLMPSGVLLAGTSLATIGYLPNYWSMFIAAIISGIGIAAFHPEAAKFANRAAGEKKGSGISIFSVGGNIGFALGPALVTPALLLWGLKGTIVLAIPAIIMFFVLGSQVKEFIPLLSASNQTQQADTILVKDEWGKFSWLTLAIVARSIIFYSLNTFLPLYWLKVLYQSEAVSGMALTIMFTAGAVSTLLGGRLADRYGVLNVVRLGFVLLVPSLYCLTMVKDVTLATLLLLPVAFSLFSISGPLVLLGQKYLPNKIGFASGVTLGLAVSIGGLVTPLIGQYADQHGLLATLTLLVFVPIFGSLVVLTLRKPMEFLHIKKS
ncbi:MAG TPA: MFS transporter [Candidatus Avacidaminococcus intestinavium]|uniref:MFS transporter n=1 Tax=Candidatus Avacidaminococcus intestinavium TaxID=2840684 RepID=A0A9D1SKW8_9FIRM|nr:MFS transporter [Candidatus Avacidaminococcus intestinavium]